MIRTVADDEEIARLPDRWHHVGAVQFSPDGRFLAVKYYHQIGVGKNYRIWDWRRRKLVVEQDSPWPGASLDFSPDGRLVVVGGCRDGFLRFYDLRPCR